MRLARALGLLTLLLAGACARERAGDPERLDRAEADRRWMDGAKFGLELAWDSVPADPESTFNPWAWIDLAKESGARFILLPPGGTEAADRATAELAQAARSRGLRVFRPTPAQAPPPSATLGFWTRASQPGALSFLERADQTPARRWVRLDARPEEAGEVDPLFRRRDDAPERLVPALVRSVASGETVTLLMRPDAEGAPRPEDLARLDEVGRWMTRNGESLYETNPGPLKPGEWGVSTWRDNRIYLHYLDGRGGEMGLPRAIGEVDAAYMFTSGASLDYRPQSDRFILVIPPVIVDPVDTIVVLEMEPAAPEPEESPEAGQGQ